MATLRIEATPSDGIKSYKLAIDDQVATMGANNKGSVDLPGVACDDGSQHRLRFSLVGAAGETLGIKVFCGDEVEVDIPGVEIDPLGEPLAFGRKDFTL